MHRRETVRLESLDYLKNFLVESQGNAYYWRERYEGDIFHMLQSEGVPRCHKIQESKVNGLWLKKDRKWEN